MRWKVESLAEREKRLTTWHRKFAYLPKEISSGQYVWLEYYERRAWRYLHAYGYEYAQWEYRLINE